VTQFVCDEDEVPHLHHTEFVFSYNYILEQDVRRQEGDIISGDIVSKYRLLFSVPLILAPLLACASACVYVCVSGVCVCLSVSARACTHMCVRVSFFLCKKKHACLHLEVTC